MLEIVAIHILLGKVDITSGSKEINDIIKIQVEYPSFEIQKSGNLQNLKVFQVLTRLTTNGKISESIRKVSS